MGVVDVNNIWVLLVVIYGVTFVSVISDRWRD